MVNKPCLDCGTLSPNGRCPPCRTAHENLRYSRRGTTTERGYGHAYRARRTTVLADATHCARCGAAFTDDNPATSGHVDDLRDIPLDQRAATAAVAELMPECARCNYGWAGRARR